MLLPPDILCFLKAVQGGFGVWKCLFSSAKGSRQTRKTVMPPDKHTHTLLGSSTDGNQIQTQLSMRKKKPNKFYYCCDGVGVLQYVQSFWFGFIVWKQTCGNGSTTQTNQERSRAPDSVHSHVCLSWIQTCSRSPGGPGCIGAAPCPGAPGGPAACAARRVSHGPGLGWSDAGGTDLHPWVPHTGDSTLSHQHTATSSTKQSQGQHGPGQSKARQGKVLQDETQLNKTGQNGTGHCDNDNVTVPGSQSKY